jgi:hypothetical protein
MHPFGFLVSDSSVVENKGEVLHFSDPGQLGKDACSVVTQKKCQNFAASHGRHRPELFFALVIRLGCFDPDRVFAVLMSSFPKSDIELPFRATSVPISDTDFPASANTI